MRQVQNEVRNNITRFHMIKRGDRVIIGVSGGADSTALLHILVQLGGILKAQYRVIHINHGIRGPEAEEDARFVESLCAGYRIPCRIVEVQAEEFAEKHRISVEEAGRVLRYSVFEEAAQAWEREADTEKTVKIAVAHNKEDNAETILMQLSRGSGLKGVAGMKPVRGRIIRPLLTVSRAEIESYLRKEEISWRTDSTNLHDDYTRNRIRHEILPRLVGEVNRGAIDNITRAGRLIGEADRYLMRQAERFLWDTLVEDRDSVGISTAELLRQESIIQSYMLRIMIGRVNRSMKNITAKHVEDIARLSEAETGKRLDLPYGMQAVRTYDMLWIGKKGFAGEAVSEEPGAGQEGFYRENFHFDVFDYGPDMKIPTGERIKWFDYDKIGDIMEIRPRRIGDYIMLESGGRKTVKALMADEKIPAAERNSIPLLTVGSDVLWVVGHRISAGYRIDSGTRRVLEVRYEGE
ncbi:tRNA(Ile)-lysidine synthase [Fusobacterium naviforme]|nr:tRNA lysidine(34) synthetase TilS [Fusobacterium naviforme]PSL11078.1 tRNA(Ile)-lysidine synthase [Fusobacterium naviforme]STO28452.1 tRNA(Ile)-lysidine synthase [Fusobacterium naviforme]